jgi:hypothetical protein
MSVYTCGQGGERAEAQTILRASGEVAAIICPVHGVIAYLGYKPGNGDDGVRTSDGTMSLAPGEYAKIGTRWLARPPRGDQVWLGLPVIVNPDTTITVAGFIDCAGWRGWLEAGIWLEEQR